MARAGISQGNPLAALGNILRKGPGRGSGRDSKSPRRELTKKLSFKGSKESLRDGAKDSPEPTRRTSEPKSPKMFRFGIRRSGSRSKKGDRDDSASETSSVSSLNVTSVKEEPMEAESSRLTVSRSANENEEKETKTTTVDQASSASKDDTSKSANRISTYFKPPEVESLSDLFATGELDALLKTKDKSDDTESPQKEVEMEKVDNTGDSEEPASDGSGLKRNNLRSSFRMYENRYREETMERKKEQSPLSTSVSTVTVKPSPDPAELSSSSEKISRNTKATDSEGADGDDSIFGSISPKADEGKNDSCIDTHRGKKQERGGVNEQMRKKLFDDELFQSDISSRYQSRAKKASTATPSLDAYAQAHKSPPPVSVIAEKKEKDTNDLLGESAEIDEQMTNTQSAEPKKNAPVSEGMEEMKEAKDRHSDESDSRKADNILAHDKPSSPDVSEEGASLSLTQSNVFEKTALEMESEKRQEEKEATNKKSAEEVTKKETPLQSVNKQPKSEVDQPKVKSSPEKEQSETLSERVANRIRKRREEREEQKSSRSTRSYDPRSRITTGKVSNARSKFDSSSPSLSPRTTRARASTESPRQLTERKVRKSEGSDSASWMSDLQKRREQRAREKDTVKPSSAEGDEDMPDWRKRMLERRKKAAEASAKTPSGISKSDRLTASPKLGRRQEAEAKLSRRDVGSGTRKSPSPSRTRRAANVGRSKTKAKNDDETTKIVAKEATDSTEDKVSDLTVVTAQEKSSEITVSSKLDSPKQEFSSPKPDVLSPKLDSPKPEVSSPKLDSPKPEDSPKLDSPEPEVSSPKPEITSPKPKIQIVSRKVKQSSSSEPVAETTCSVDVKPTVRDTEGEDSQLKNEDEVFALDIKQGPTSIRKDVQSSSPQSPSNLSNQAVTDSQTGTGSRRSSNSSEQEVGMPFRSRGISLSRSPTPTSLTPGPLKLPADAGIPEWKKKVLEHKKESGSSKKADLTSKKSEPVVPAWKKELLAKRAKAGEEVLMFTHSCM